MYKQLLCFLEQQCRTLNQGVKLKFSILFLCSIWNPQYSLFLTPVFVMVCKLFMEHILIEALLWFPKDKAWMNLNSNSLYYIY